MKKLLASVFVVAGALAFVPGHADPITVPDDGPAYVYVDDSGPTVEVWQESNGKAGLQRTGTNPDTKLA